MNRDNVPTDSFDGLPAEQYIDRICDRFEAAWKQAERPKIEDFFADCPKAWASALLRELLPIERTYRRWAGETPSGGEYVARFPGYAEAIAQAFEGIDQQQTEQTSRHRHRDSCREAADRPAQQPRNRSSCHVMDYSVRMW